MLRGSTEKGEGYKRRGFLATAPLAFFAVQACTVAVVPSLSYVCALESEKLQPALPGGERGTVEGERRKWGRQARRCPAGPSHGGARGAQGRASRHPLLSSSLFSRAPPDRLGCNPHSCGGARVLCTSPRAAGIPEPLTAAAGAQQQRRHQGPHLRAAAGGSPPQVSGAATASAAFRGTTSEQRRSSDRLKRPPRLPGCARARVRRPEPAPTPRERASRARALRPAWPPLLVDVTPGSHPGSGQAPAESAKT